MKSFNFKLKALMRLKESKREQALTNLAHAIEEVQVSEEKLGVAHDKYQKVVELLGIRQKGTFRSDEIEALQSSLFIERENVAKAELQLKQAQELEVARRKIFLDQDSQFKAIDRLREKQREEHFSVENKMEQAELEDVIGSRFLFQRINGHV